MGCLADKLVRGQYRVPVRRRFMEKLELYAGNKAACRAIRRRMHNALALQEMVLAVWLIVKGFNPAAIGAGRADAGPADSLTVRSAATHEASPVATASAA